VYGTVMIGKTHATNEQLLALTREWAEAKGNGVGYVDQWVLRTDDGQVVVAVRFASKQAYDKLADDPDQDTWYQEKLRPMLDDDPTWFDGEWSKP